MRAAGRIGHVGLVGPGPADINITMNTRAAMICVGITTLAAAAALLLLRAPPPGGTAPAVSPAPAWLTSLDREQIAGLALTDNSGRRIEIVSEPGLNAYVLTGGGQPPWMVESSRVASAAKIVSDAGSGALAADLIQPSPGSYKLEWSFARDRQMRQAFSFDTLALGGRALITIAPGGPSLQVDRAALALFTPESLLAWRQAQVFPLRLEPSSLSISTPGREVTLVDARGEGWRVTDLNVLAEPGAVAGLVRNISFMSVTSFIGLPEPQMRWEIDPATGRDGPIAGGSPPTFTLTVRSTMPRDAGAGIAGGDVAKPGEGAMAQVEQSLRVYAAADPAGKTVAGVASVRVDGKTVAGPILVTLPRSQVESISAEDMSYVSAVVMAGSTSDIRSVGLAEGGAAFGNVTKHSQRPGVELARLPDGRWGAAPQLTAGAQSDSSVEEPARTLSALPGGAVGERQMAALLELLQRVPASGRVLSPPKLAEGSVVWPVRVKMFSGLIVTLECARIEPAGAPTANVATATFAVRRGEIYYLFGGGAAQDAATLLGLLLPTEG